MDKRSIPFVITPSSNPASWQAVGGNPVMGFLFHLKSTKLNFLRLENQFRPISVLSHSAARRLWPLLALHHLFIRLKLCQFLV